MPRPKSKTELLSLSKVNYDKLIEFIEAMDEIEQNKEFPEGTMNRSIKDVLTHLHHWHLLIQEWYKIGMTGVKLEMPAKGYSWKTTPELNKWIWEKYQDYELKQAKQLFSKSFKKVRSIIEKHTNDELFEKKRYKWTGTTSMGSYFVSATSSHYEWALKLIKKAKK